MLGIDVWDGTDQQVEFYRNSAGITFPVLTKGKIYVDSLPSRIDRDGVYIIGGDGKYTYCFDYAANGLEYDEPINFAETDSAIAYALSQLPPVAIASTRQTAAFVSRLDPSFLFRVNWSNKKIQFNLPESWVDKRIRMHIFDITGRQILAENLYSLEQGIYGLDLPVAGALSFLSQGYYFVQVRSQKQTLSKIVHLGLQAKYDGWYK